jgi:hypothetical protein
METSLDIKYTWILSTQALDCFSRHPIKNPQQKSFSILEKKMQEWKQNASFADEI